MGGLAVQLTFGDFELDEARFELRRSGRVVPVQPKALELVFYLARNRQRVVTKEELLKTVWKGAVVTEASLSQALSLARRALSDDAEQQQVIRTARSKGLQFVALDRPAPLPVEIAVRREPRDVGNSALETAQESRVEGAPAAEGMQLFAAIHCDQPLDGGASWSLADVDEVEIGRGSARRAERQDGLTRVLRIAVPGRLMSRAHARLCRTPHGWLLVDGDSRNGTFVNGQRVGKQIVAQGDVIDCGHTLFGLAIEPRLAWATDVASPPLDAMLASVSPRVLAIDRELCRIATSDLPVLLLGESGVGKARVAQALHAHSRRSGTLVRIDWRTPPPELLAQGLESRTLAAARGGTLLINHVEHVTAADAATLASMLDAAADVRLISTSVLPVAELEARVPAEVLMRLSGYRCVVPPLRDRSADLGLLVASILGTIGHPPDIAIDVAAAHALMRYSWPGNLRELAHKLKSAVALSAGSIVRLEHLSPELR